MPIVTDVEIPAERFVLGEVLADADGYYAELTQFVPTSDQLIPYIWIEHDDLPYVEQILRDHPRTADVLKCDERAGRTLYQIEWVRPFDDFLSIIMDGNVLVNEARGTAELWEFELLATDRDDLAAFQSACNRSNVPIEIRTVFGSIPSSAERLGLTEKQGEVLRLAYEEGYFEIPREMTVTELGEALGISSQAASKRLRRALATVVEHVCLEST